MPSFNELKDSNKEPTYFDILTSEFISVTEKITLYIVDSNNNPDTISIHCYSKLLFTINRLENGENFCHKITMEKCQNLDIFDDEGHLKTGTFSKNLLEAQLELKIEDLEIELLGKNNKFYKRLLDSVEENNSDQIHNEIAPYFNETSLDIPANSEDWRIVDSFVFECLSKNKMDLIKNSEDITVTQLFKFLFKYKGEKENIDDLYKIIEERVKMPNLSHQFWGEDNQDGNQEGITPLFILMEKLKQQFESKSFMALASIASETASPDVWAKSIKVGYNKGRTPLLTLIEILGKHPENLELINTVNNVVKKVPADAWSKALEACPFFKGETPLRHLLDILAKNPENLAIIAISTIAVKNAPSDVWRKSLEKMKGNTPLLRLIFALERNLQLITMLKIALKNIPADAWGIGLDVGNLKGETPLLTLIEILGKHPENLELINAVNNVVKKVPADAWGKALEASSNKGETPLRHLLDILAKNPENLAIIAISTIAVKNAPSDVWRKSLEKMKGDTPLIVLMFALSRNLQLVKMVKIALENIPADAWGIGLDAGDYLKGETPLRQLMLSLTHHAQNEDLVTVANIVVENAPIEIWSKTCQSFKPAVFKTTALYNLIHGLTQRPKNKNLLTLVSSLIKKGVSDAWGVTIESGELKGETPLRCLMGILDEDPQNEEVIKLAVSLVEKAPIGAWSKALENINDTAFRDLTFALERNPKNEALITAVTTVAENVSDDIWSKTPEIREKQTPFLNLINALSKNPENVKLVALVIKVTKKAFSSSWIDALKADKPLDKLVNTLKTNLQNKNLITLLIVILENILLLKPVNFNIARFFTLLNEYMVANLLSPEIKKLFNLTWQQVSGKIPNENLLTQLHQHLKNDDSTIKKLWECILSYEVKFKLVVNIRETLFYFDRSNYNLKNYTGGLKAISLLIEFLIGENNLSSKELSYENFKIFCDQHSDQFTVGSLISILSESIGEIEIQYRQGGLDSKKISTLIEEYTNSTNDRFSLK